MKIENLCKSDVTGLVHFDAGGEWWKLCYNNGVLFVERQCRELNKYFHKYVFVRLNDNSFVDKNGGYAHYLPLNDKEISSMLLVAYDMAVEKGFI